MAFTRSIAAFASLLALCPIHRDVAEAVARPNATAAAADLSPPRYLEDVKFLASDALQGRGNGSPELDKAAEYIADQFRRMGLQPAGENNTFFQSFEITTGATLGVKNELHIAGTVLKIDDDFVPIAFSDTAQFDGPLVFVGYGITAPEYKYDDYAGIDAANKIVVAFSHEPQEIDPKSVFAGTNFTPYASYVSKAINARLRGAKGIIFITDPTHDYDDLGSTARREEASDIGIPAVLAQRRYLSNAFKAGGKDLAELQKAIDKDLTSQSFELPNLRGHIATEVIRTRKAVRNVMAALPGSDAKLKDQWIVIGAHYDHLGLGGADSLAPSQVGQIHHGADDNASGAAGVMELARVAAANKATWKRSVLFMAFAGEEAGLLGSSHFVNHPTMRVDAMDAMLNMDMIGRVQDDRLYVGGIGTSTALKPALDAFTKGSGLNISYTESGYGASDQTSFNAKRIPVLFFFSGIHTDYHKPSDTAEKINTAGAIKVLALVYQVAGRLASQPQRLTYVEVQQPAQPGRGASGGYGPYFGSIPDFRDDLKGVLFADVVTNSPAGKAGLKGGDLMIEFDGKTVQSLNDYAFVLRQKKPGDIISVVVKRGGHDVRVNVTLEARK